MKTLLIRLSSLGDVLLTTAVVRMLKNADPTGTIDICTRPEYRELFAANPHVREIMLYNDQTPSTTKTELRRKEKYDTVVDLHNNFRTKILRRNLARQILVVKKRTFAKWLLVNSTFNLLKSAPDVIGRYAETLAPLGIKDDGGGPEFFPAESALPDNVKKFLEAPLVIGICPGAKHFTKRWPSERYAELCSKIIQDRGAAVMLFGGEMDSKICAAIADAVHSDKLFNACGRQSVSQIAIAMDQCASIITNDSGLMHLAAARKRPVVAIFGSTVCEFGFVPRHNVNVVEVEGLSCRPCSHIGRSSCPKGHFKCMLDTSAERILADLGPTS